MRKILILSCVLTFQTTYLAAQAPVKLTLDDGSSIRCQILAASIPFATPYGSLAVPVGDIVRIRFGAHATAAERKTMDAAAKTLGSGVHRERETAAKTLRGLGRSAVPTLRKAADGPDREAAKRATDMLAAILEADPREVLDYDTLTLRRFTVEGSVSAETLAFRSSVFGDFSVPLGKIDTLLILGRHDGTVAVDVTKDWTGTQMIFVPGDVVTITATGVVDLWPQTPGQYVATPKGYHAIGKGGQFNAGTLIGRIGGGPVFIIGEKATVTVREAGELHLSVVQSPWNNESSGAYSVTIRSGR